MIGVQDPEQFTTCWITPNDPMLLVLDKDRLARDVSEITEDDYFRKIQDSFAKLRGR